MASNVKSIKFKVSFETKSEKEIPLSAYAFDSQGEFLGGAPVNKEGQAELGIPENQLSETRIFFAPTPPQGAREQTPTLETMAARAAYEPLWKFNAQKPVQDLLTIPGYLSKFWPWCFCRVRGKAVRPIVIQGTTYQMPVCHARVHICEVDPLIIWIPKWPDYIIHRIRDEYLAIIDQPFRKPPRPDPPPEFAFDPGVIDPSPINIARMQPGAKVALNPQPLPPREGSATATPMRMAMPGPQPEPPGPPVAAMAAKLSDSLSIETKAVLSSPTTSIVRDAILKNLDLIRPYFCYWPWLHPFLICSEVAVLETDQYGRFDTTIPYLCFGDHPDLYFWVEFCLNGVWTTVYHPPIYCHTYWNYVCGSEVTISVTDPRVPWCGNPNLPGKVVAVMSIGNEVSIPEIRRSSAGVAEGLTTVGQPFAGVLEPHVIFGAEDLIASGITHYRWSYRKGFAGAWKVMTRTVVRHYGMVIGPNLFFLPFLLGPDPAFPGMNMFKIQPKDPPPGSLGWAPIDAHEDTATGFFESHLEEGGDAELAQGKYELKLELFKAAAPGVPINLTTEGVTLKVPTSNAPFGPGVVPTRTVPTDPGFPLDPIPDRVFVSGGGDVLAFRLVLHVDNTICQAGMEDISVNGNAAGPCGFIQYTPNSNAHIRFLARHPHGFATFQFQVVRGSSGRVEAACAPAPAPILVLPSVQSPVVNLFVRDGGSNFTKDVPVDTNHVPEDDMVGNCTKAAFAETLHVYAMATDGWNRASWLDAEPLPKAFALEPQ